jgi:CRISPR/Cas system CSM-associated protein Csm2 small subunit
MSDEPTDKKANDIVKTDPVAKDSFAKLLTCELLDSNGLTYKPKCKICNSPFRKDAEALFEKENSHAKVRDFLDSMGLAVTVSAVRVHIVEHYRNADRMLSLVEYCDNLEKMVSQRRSRREDLETLVAISRLEIARISSLQTGNLLSQEKDRNTMLMLCMKTQRDCLDSLNKMEDSDAKIKSIQNKFIEVWKEMIAAAPNEDERRVLVDALQKFREVIENTAELKS